MLVEMFISFSQFYAIKIICFESCLCFSLSPSTASVYLQILSATEKTHILHTLQFHEIKKKLMMLSFVTK